MAVIGVAEVLMSVNPGPGFTNGMRRAVRDFTGDLEHNLRKATVAAFAIAGVAAVKFTTLYEERMNKIIALTDTSTKQMEQFNAAILDISKQTGVGPQQLAESLYFIQSAGFAAAEGLTGAAAEADVTRQALEALDSVARLVAIGFGDAEDAGQALTSLMIAYKDSNLSAAKAADLMAAAVKVGKVEADQLARTIGDFIPIAAQLGVSAEQALALESALTQTGQTASESATQVRALLASIIDLQTTTDKDKLQIVENFDLDVKKIKEAVQKDLRQALIALQEAVGDSDEALSILFGNVRAFRGVIGALGSNYEGAVKGLQDASRGLGEVFAGQLKVSETFEQRFNRISAAVQTYALEIGGKLLPAIESLSEALVPTVMVLKAFADALVAAVPYIVPITAGFLAWKAASAVAATGIFSIVTSFRDLVDAFKIGGAAIKTAIGPKILGALTSLISPTTLITGAVVAGTFAWQKYQERLAETRKNIKDLVISMAEGKTVAESLAEALDRTLSDDKRGDIKALNALNISKSDIDTVSELTNKIDQLTKKRNELLVTVDPETNKILAVTGSKEIDNINDALDVLEDRYNEVRKSARQFIETAFAKGVFDGARLNFQEIINSLQGIAAPVTQSSTAIEALFAQLAAISDVDVRTEAIANLTSELNNLTEEERSFAVGTAEGNRVSLQLATSLAKTTPILRELSAGFANLDGSQLAAAISAEDLKKANEKVSLSMEDALANIDRYISAQERLETASEAVKSAREREADALRTLTEIKTISPAEKAQEEVKAAQDRAAIAQANNRIDDARNAVITRQNELNFLKIDLLEKEAAAFKDVQEAQEKVSEANNKYLEIQRKIALSEQELVIRAEEVAAAQRSVADARRAVADQEKKTRDEIVKANEDLASAEFSLAQAVRDVEVAQRGVRDAEFEVLKAHRQVEKSSEEIAAIYVEIERLATDLAEAQLGVETATLNVAKAQFEVADSVNDIQKALLTYREAQYKVLKVQRDYSETLQDIQKKAQDVRTAQADLNKVFRETSANGKEAKDAIDALRDAQLNLRSSALDVADAQDKLLSAQRALAQREDGQSLIELRRNVERAKIELQRARNAQANARRNVEDANQTISDLPAEQARRRFEALLKVSQAQRELNNEQFKATSFSLDYAKAVQEIQDASLGVQKAQLGQQESLLGVAEAQLALVLAQQKIEDVSLKRLELDSKMRDALLAQQEAELGVVQALEAVADARNAVTVADQKRVEQSQAVKEAAQAVAEKETELSRILEGTAEVNRRVESAEQELRNARLSQARSIEDHTNLQNDLDKAYEGVEKAIDAVNEANMKLVQASPEYVRNAEAVRLKEKDLEKAKRDVATAVSELTLLEQTQAADRKTVQEKFADDLRNAEKNLAEARSNVAKAIRDESKAIDDFNLAKQNLINQSTKEQVELAERFFNLKNVAKDAAPELKTAINDVLDQIEKAGLNIGLFPAIDTNGNLVLTTLRDANGNPVKILPTSNLPQAQPATPVQVGVTGTGNVGAGDLRFSGGGVMPGVPYSTNEAGMEMYRSFRTGQIYPLRGGRGVRYFPDAGEIIPASYNDNSVHNWNLQSQASDSDNVARQLYRQIRRMGRGRPGR